MGSAQSHDQWPERETQQDGECKWDEDIPGEIKRRDDDGGNRQRGQARRWFRGRVNRAPAQTDAQSRVGQMFGGYVDQSCLVSWPPAFDPAHRPAATRLARTMSIRPLVSGRWCETATHRARILVECDANLVEGKVVRRERAPVGSETTQFAAGQDPPCRPAIFAAPSGVCES